MLTRFLCFLLIVLVQPSFCQEITIFLVGNSTMANKSWRGGHPETGWGQTLPLYFTEGVKIQNHAMNGRSTKSFLAEGRWDSVVNRVKPGDYIIIEFGHNDSKKEDTTKFADANTDYRLNLIKFINDAISKNAIPILATPIVRRRFSKDGNFYDVHGDYPKVVREVAEEKNVFLLDLHKSSEKLIISYGEESSKKLFLHIESGEYHSLPKGLTDDTHLSPYGAFRVCDLAIAELKAKVPPLAKYIKD